jgi:uncharacterized protein (TIGR02145 family)
LWVDYVKIENAAPVGTWSRATVANPSAGTVAPETNSGFWLQGSTPSYSETVTVELTNVSGEFSWCTYASDCPPSMNAEAAFRLHGTPPFTLTDANGVTQTVNGNGVFVSDMTIEPMTITDATGCSGSLCPYTGSDLYIDATHLCRQRASGAENWEAWMKDTRDNELYRIVFLPDDKWWTAEEMRYDASGTKQSYKCPNEKQRTIYNHPNIACPTGWTVPSLADFIFVRNIMSTAELLIVGSHQYGGEGVDKFGFSVDPSLQRSDESNTIYPPNGCLTGVNSSMMCCWDTIEGERATYYYANTSVAHNIHSWNQTRCIRQL